MLKKIAATGQRETGLPYGGIRVEDNVLVTEQGSRNLTGIAFRSGAGARPMGQADAV